MNDTKSSQPFFIFGAPRSGTTVLRDVLRLHPTLECPEETFFYRWDAPFKSKRFEMLYLRDPTIRKHRRIDGVNEQVFWEIYERSASRKDLQIGYMRAFLRARGAPIGRWFDKTPQNSNNLLRIIEDFPDSKLVHMHRNPLDVIGSLMQGRKFEPHSFDAALATWFEAVQAGVFVAKHFPGKVMAIGLDDLVHNSQSTVTDLCSFLELDGPIKEAGTMIGRPPHRYHALSAVNIGQMIELCRPYLKQFGYPTEVAAYERLLTAAQTAGRDTAEGRAV